MRKLVLREDILEKIKQKPFVLAQMATHLDISTAYLLRLIRENDTRLTDATVISILKKEFSITRDTDILIEKFKENLAPTG